ncbi:hypothetical protein llap_2342 [Limosa lapponica baueri]|uniref:Rna-directed dna polymerase from mobile element jockey-like n=1 Tax=Limosa lapponica baueri TaxID=1758121 RepID=A0A2I0UMW2_LIMLA|nr:hypothetical protein llap_2342 [Limosa lapponica baueri]
MRQTRSVVRTLNFRKAKLQLFKELVKRTPWETVLRDKCKKSNGKGKRPAWLSQDPLVKLKAKKKLYRQFRQDEVSWEEYRDAAQLCRDKVRKAKAWLELNLARNAKNNKKGFYRYVNQKRNVKESISPMISKNGKLVTTDEEKAEVPSDFLPQSSLPTPLLTPPDLKDQAKTGAIGMKNYPLSVKTRFETF